MSYTEVKDVTSNAVGSDTDGSLWDVTIENYERVRQKAEMLLLQAVQYSFPTTFKQYINKPQWTTIGEFPPAGECILRSRRIKANRLQCLISLSRLS